MSPRAASTLKIAKFGGTSVATAAQLRKVQAIIDADPLRRVIVPSAPGKADAKDTKVTDLLYLCQQLAAKRPDFSLLGENQGVQKLQKRGLSRAVSAKDGYLLALGNLHIYSA